MMLALVKAKQNINLPTLFSFIKVYMYVYMYFLCIRVSASMGHGTFHMFQTEAKMSSSH